MRKAIIRLSLGFAALSTTLQLCAAVETPFKLTNALNSTFDVVVVTAEGTQQAQPLGGKGIIALLEVPKEIYIFPKITKGKWSQFTFQPAKGQTVHVSIARLKAGSAVLSPEKGVKNNITAEAIKVKANTPPPKKPAPPVPPAPPAPPGPKPAEPVKVKELTKEQWTAIGIKNKWFPAGAELPKGTAEDLQKQLDKEALDKLLERIHKEAKISPKKLPIIEEALKAFWADAGRGQKTSMKFLPNYIFKALEQGDDAAKVAGMIGLWMGMPERARDAWRGEKPEKIGAFLEERYRLSQMLVIPTKPETPEKIKPTVQKRDKRPLAEQAKEWDENKLNREISKRRFAISGGPFGEKDPKKKAAIEKEIELLEGILEKKETPARG